MTKSADWMEGFGSTGVGLGSFRGAKAADLVEIAKLAEDLGYGSIWVSEDHGREAFSVLGAMANKTMRIRLGTGVVGIYARSAPSTAQAVATLDELSDGRAFLGLGLGDLRLARQWHSGSTRQLAERLRDYLCILRALLQGGREYSGSALSARNLRLGFDPVRSDIPIFVASLSSSTMAVVSELADGWLPMSVSLSFVEQSRRQLGSNKPISLYVVCCVDDDRDRARANARMMLTYFLALMPALRHAVADVIPPDRLAALLDRWSAAERHEAAELIEDNALDSLAIAGTPGECRDLLRAYQEEHVYPVIAFPYRSDKAQIQKTLYALAPAGTGES